MNQYLDKFYEGDGISFVYNGWRTLFGHQETVYKDLWVEFFATIKFEVNKMDLMDRRAINF